jgi:hypothetical protein
MYVIAKTIVFFALYLTCLEDWSSVESARAGRAGNKKAQEREGSFAEANDPSFDSNALVTRKPRPCRLQRMGLLSQLSVRIPLGRLVRAS